MAEKFILPRQLNSDFAVSLAASLNTLRDRPLEIDAASVHHVGTLCLQVLISARKAWQNDHQPFKVTGASEQLISALETLGIDSLHIGIHDGA